MLYNRLFKFRNNPQKVSRNVHNYIVRDILVYAKLKLNNYQSSFKQLLLKLLA